MADPASLEVSGAVGTVTMASPPTNALSPALVEGLDAALAEASGQEVKVLVIRSALDGPFAAGADIKHMSTASPDEFERYGNALRAMFERLAGLEAITIAVIDGFALGGGLELAIACAMRVAASDARLGVPEARLGLIPGAGGTQRLPRLVGRGRALDLVLTGRAIDGRTGFEWGLVDRLTEPGQAEAEARALAEELSGMSRSALLAGLHSVDAAQAGLAEGLEVERREIGRCFSEGEAREGLSAFLEKRRPQFA